MPLKSNALPGEDVETHSATPNDPQKDPQKVPATATFTLATPLPSTPSSTSSKSNHDLDTYPGDDPAVRALNDEGMFNEGASIDSDQAELVGFGLRTGPPALMSTYVRIIKTVVGAWLDKRMIIEQDIALEPNKIHTMVAPRLNCAHCRCNTLLNCHDSTYRNWHVNENMWFEKKFINQFGQLLQHVAHGAACAREVPQYYSCSFPVQDHMWDQGTQNIVPQLTLTSETIACVAGDGSHYAVMEVGLSRRYITVYDGFASSSHVDKWVKYVKYLLTSMGVIPVDCGKSYMCMNTS